MFNWFKTIFQGKKQQPQEVEPEFSDAQLAFMKAKYKQLEAKISEEMNKRNKEAVKESEEANGKCPKCGSTNVNDRIKRFQGKIDGRSSGYGWNALSFGESYSSGYIKGDFDTNEVNKCNDCENEWKKKKVESPYYSGYIIENELRMMRYFFRDLHEARHNVKWDKNDLKETFNSLAEKKEHMLQKAMTGTWRTRVHDFWSDYPIELINKIAKDRLDGYAYKSWKENYDLEALINIAGLRTLDQFKF